MQQHALEPAAIYLYSPAYGAVQHFESETAPPDSGFMTFTAIVTGTGLRNDDGSSRASVIRRRCAIGNEVVLRKGAATREICPAVAVYFQVPRLFGLLGASYAQIGYLDPHAAASMVARLDSTGEVRARIKSVYAPEEKDSPRVSLTID